MLKGQPLFCDRVSGPFSNTKEMKKSAVWGLLVIYVEQDYVEKFIGLLQYPDVDEENWDDMKDACGAICNLIAGQFRIDFTAQGYPNMEMSHFSSYRNTSLAGVHFYNKVREKYELSFYIKGEKRLVVELTMGPVPKEESMSGSVI